MATDGVGVEAMLSTRPTIQTEEHPSNNGMEGRVKLGGVKFSDF